MTNVCSETPTEETIDFVNNSEIPTINNMPDQPGLWTVKTLCSFLEIPISMSLKSNQLEVKLSIAF
ncbi:MAG: hypothetical protein ACK44D_10420 [Bacteroidia bacterium]